METVEADMLENSMKLRLKRHNVYWQIQGIHSRHNTLPMVTRKILGFPAELWNQALTTQRRARGSGPIEVHLSRRAFKGSGCVLFLVQGIVYCIARSIITKLPSSTALMPGIVYMYIYIYVFMENMIWQYGAAWTQYWIIYNINIIYGKKIQCHAILIVQCFDHGPHGMVLPFVDSWWQDNDPDEFVYGSGWGVNASVGSSWIPYHQDDINVEIMQTKHWSVYQSLLNTLQ